VRLQIKKEIFAIFKKYKMFTINRITLRNGQKNIVRNIYCNRLLNICFSFLGIFFYLCSVGKDMEIIV
jgi:hypothetical protein